MKSILYVGTYTRDETGGSPQKEGLLVYQFDQETGILERIQAVDAGQDPTFLTVTGGGATVFAANHLDEGAVCSFHAGEDGRLTFINRQPVHGADPCYVSLDPKEGWLLTASYSSGTFTVLPVGEAMRLQPATDVVNLEGKGPNTARQDRAHAHSVRFSPDGRFIFGVDLGTDRVWVYRLDEKIGKLIPHNPPAFYTHPGAGPRHLDYSVDGRYVFIANELDSTVTACSWDAEAGVLKELQTLSTVEPGFQGENTVADIHVNPSGEFLYVSNRGEDSLAAYRIDRSNGLLQRIGSFGCGGQGPRNFAIHAEGKYLLVANQFTGNIVVFQTQSDGGFVPTGIEVYEHAPVCLVFVE